MARYFSALNSFGVLPAFFSAAASDCEATPVDSCADAMTATAAVIAIAHGIFRRSGMWRLPLSFVHCEDWGKAANSISCGVMRPVSGFERPVMQWGFVGLGVLLVLLSSGEALALRRARTQMEALRAENLGVRVDRDALQARAAREQS